MPTASAVEAPVLELLVQLASKDSGEFIDELYSKFLSAIGDDRLVLCKLIVQLLKSGQASNNGDLLPNIAQFLEEFILLPSSVDEISIEHYNTAAEIAVSHQPLFDVLQRKLFKRMSSYITSCQALQASTVLSTQLIDLSEMLERYLPDIVKASGELAEQEVSSGSLVGPEKELTLYLHFAKYLLIDGRLDKESVQEMQVMLFALIANKNSNISEVALRLFQNQIQYMIEGPQNPEFLFSVICRLSSEPSLSEHASSIWVSWIDQSESIGPTESLISSTSYWQLLQDGLRRGHSLRKKNSVYIISRTISRITFDVTNREFVWKNAERTTYHNIWEKYLTFVEIVAIDGAGNQFYDAVPELRRLLTPPHNIIPSTWIGILFSLAFNTTSTGVAKIAYELILTLPCESLVPWIYESSEFYSGDFLPFMSSPQRFSIRAADPETCLHGEDLARLIATIISSSGSKEPILQTLSYIQDKDEGMFAGARAYLLKGLADGVTSSSSKALDIGDIPLIILRCIKRIGRMRSDLCTLMYLKIMRAINIDDGEAAQIYLSAISSILGESQHLLNTEDATELLAPNFSSSTWLNEIQGKEDSACGGTQYSALLESLVSGRSFDTVAILLAILVAGPSWFKTYTDTLDSVKSLEIRARAVLGILSTGNSLKRLLLAQTAVQSLVEEALSSIPAATDELDAEVLPRMTVLADALDRLASAGRDEQSLDWLSHDKIQPYNPFSRIVALLSAKDSEADSISSLNRIAVLMRTYYCKERLLLFIYGITPTITQQEVMDISQLLSAHPGYNMQKNVHSKRVRASISSSVFGLLRLSLEGTGSEKYSVLFEVIRQHRKHVGENIAEVLDSVKIVLERCGDISASAGEEIAEFLSDIWEFAGDMRRAAEPRKIYIATLHLAFHPKILALASKRSDIEQILLKLANDAFVIGKGRRSILPGLSSALRDSFIEAPEVFCALESLSELMVRLLGFEVAGTVEFHIEKPLARMFSDFKLKEKAYVQYYDYYETQTYSFVFENLLRLDCEIPSQRGVAFRIRSRLIEIWSRSVSNKSFEKEKKVTYLQALLTLERIVEYDSNPDTYVEKLLWILSREGNPRYRFLIEWALSLAIIRRPRFTARVWECLESEMTTKKPNPKYHSSLIEILLMIGPHLDKTLREQFYTRFVNSIVPLVSHAKVAVRHSAITATLKIWEDVNKYGYQHLVDNALFSSIKTSLLQSPYFRDLHSDDHMESTTFSPLQNLTLEGVFNGTYLGGTDFIEHIPSSLFKDLSANEDRVQKLAFEKGTAESVQPVQISFNKSEEADALAARKAVETANTVLQTKTRAASTIVGSSPAESSLELVACHVTSLPNLGGLSRVSEIFGVEKLYLSDAGVKSNPAFTALSVSSHDWLSIESLSTEKNDLKEFFDQRRKCGYTIVGIEQTDSSKVLGEYKFPRKTVLVLGSEKEGMPAEVLSLMDELVIIEQFGQTRSLNVQVAAGIVISEFNRQIRH